MQKSSRLLQAWLSSSRHVLGELQEQCRNLEAEEKKLENEMACGEAVKQEVVAPLQEFVREQFQEGSRRGECAERCLVWFFSLFRVSSSCLILSQQMLLCQHFFGGCQAAIASLREVLVARAQQVSSRAREERERVQRKLAGACCRACFFFNMILLSEDEISVLYVQPACTSFRRLSAVTFPASRLHCASSRRKSTLQRRLWTSRHALFLFPPLPPLLISDAPQDLDKARERMREISAGMSSAQELMRELVGVGKRTFFLFPWCEMESV